MVRHRGENKERRCRDIIINKNGSNTSTERHYDLHNNPEPNPGRDNEPAGKQRATDSDGRNQIGQMSAEYRGDRVPVLILGHSARGHLPGR